jgi:predicted metal-binding protein
MRNAPLQPAAQLLVCTNAREASDPLRSGCGAHGPRVYQSLKRAVAEHGRVADVWITRSLCLGQCPRDGCAVAIQPANEHFVDVKDVDAAVLMARALGAKRTT